VSARRSEFVSHVIEVFAPWGRVEARRMFGGWGLFRDDRMFALVADDTLYLKADDTTRARFEDRGLAPFTYSSRGRERVMRYFRAPEEALDDPQEMLPWARLAWGAALRAETVRRERKARAERRRKRPARSGRKPEA